MTLEEIKKMSDEEFIKLIKTDNSLFADLTGIKNKIFNVSTPVILSSLLNTCLILYNTDTSNIDLKDAIIKGGITTFVESILLFHILSLEDKQSMKDYEEKIIELKRMLDVLDEKEFMDLKERVRSYNHDFINKENQEDFKAPKLLKDLNATKFIDDLDYKTYTDELSSYTKKKNNK